MNINILFFICMLSLSGTLSAQNVKIVEKVYTYEEAVMVLTSSEDDDEFQIKGELPKILTVGEQIHLARVKHNITLAKLSLTTGLNESILIKIEEDKVTPTRSIIMKIEEFLGEDIILMDAK